MRIYYDTEFIEHEVAFSRGCRTIDLISIGLVREDGASYYAVNASMPVNDVKDHPWLRRHVWPHLPTIRQDEGPRADETLDRSHKDVKLQPAIASDVREFIIDVLNPELWAYYAAYDHVALCWLWGSMVDLPSGIPMWTNDLKQEMARLGVERNRLPEDLLHHHVDHNALSDAQWNRALGEYLMNVPDPASGDWMFR